MKSILSRMAVCLATLLGRLGSMRTLFLILIGFSLIIGLGFVGLGGLIPGSTTITLGQNTSCLLYNKDNSSLKEIIRPPKLAKEQFEESLDIIKGHNSKNEYHLASKFLSTIVVKQIQQIQGRNCDQPNLQCGHQDCKVQFF